MYSVAGHLVVTMEGGHLDVPLVQPGEEGVAEVASCARRVRHLDKVVELIRGRSNHWPAQNDACPCFSFLPAKETGYSRIGFPG